MSMTNRGATPVEVTAVEIKGFDSPGACAAGSAAKDGVFACNVPATIPRNAKGSRSILPGQRLGLQRISIFTPALMYSLIEL